MGTFENDEDADEMLQSVYNIKKTYNILSSMQKINLYDNTLPLHTV